MVKMFLIQKLQKKKLIHSNVVNNSYQQNSRVLYTFVPNKSFGQLLDISHKNFIFLEIFDSEFSYIEVWFTDQNSKHVEIEDKTEKNDLLFSSNKRQNYCKRLWIFVFIFKMGRNIRKQ